MRHYRLGDHLDVHISYKYDISIFDNKFTMESSWFSTGWYVLVDSFCPFDYSLIYNRSPQVVKKTMGIHFSRGRCWGLCWCDKTWILLRLWRFRLEVSHHGPMPIAIDSVRRGPYEWPKLNGFHWRYFTPISGDISPYLFLVFRGPCRNVAIQCFLFLPITSWRLNQPISKICASQIGSIFPRVNIKTIWSTTTTT